MTSIITILKDQNINADTFCFAPYINLDLDQSGEMFTCYRGKQKVGNWKELPLDDEFNNNQYKKIRKELFTGNRSSNCLACWDAEDHGSASPRQMFFSLISSYPTDQIIEIVKEIKNNPELGNINHLKRGEVRPSSLCNLKCLHCGPHSSTKWINDLKDKDLFTVYKETVNGLDNNITHKNIHNYFKNTLSSDSPFTENIKKVLSKTKIIQFAGGEPLLDPNHISWLDYFVNVSNTSCNQDLHYNSNFNIKDIEKYFDYWKQFNSVTIRISVDSSPETYEYFRRDGNVSIIEKNIEKIKKEFGDTIRLQLSITFNMFAALEWKNIQEWWQSLDIDFHSSLVRKHPTSAIYLPDSLKIQCQTDMEQCMVSVNKSRMSNMYKEHFTEYTIDCKNYMINSYKVGTTLPDKCISYFKIFDKKSSLQLLDYYPQFKEYYK